MNQPDDTIANLDHWLDRPLTEVERADYAAQQQESPIHRFNCLCEQCSDRRRSMVAEDAANRRRLLSPNEAKSVRRGDVFAWLVVAVLCSMAFYAYVIAPALDTIGGR